MPIPLLVPVVGALAAAVSLSSQSPATKIWKILIEDDVWKEGRGYIVVNWKERIVVGDSEFFSDRRYPGDFSHPSLGPEWDVLQKIWATFDGRKVREWIGSRLSQLEEMREKGPEVSQLTFQLGSFLRNEAALLPGEWTFFIPDDVFCQVSEEGDHGYIDVDYVNRKVTAYVLSRGESPPPKEDHVDRVLSDLHRPISGEEVRRWFETRGNYLERERREDLVRGHSSLRYAFTPYRFSSVFVDAGLWMGTFNWPTEATKGLLSQDLKYFIGSEAGKGRRALFEPADLVRPAVSFIASTLRSKTKSLVGSVDLVEGDEILKILDEPYLFLQIYPRPFREYRREEYEEALRQIAEEMGDWTDKDSISLQKGDDGRLTCVQISLPWKP